MSLSCWIRSAFVKGWKEEGGDSSFDGEDILCIMMIFGRIWRTGREERTVTSEHLGSYQFGLALEKLKRGRMRLCGKGALAPPLGLLKDSRGNACFTLSSKFI